MATRYTMRAFEIHALTFQLFEPQSFYWDTKSEQMLSLSSFRKLWMSIFLVFFVVFLSGWCLCLFLVTQELFVKDRVIVIPLSNILILLVGVLLWGYPCLLFLAALCFGKEFTSAWNALKQLEAGVKKGTKRYLNSWPFNYIGQYVWVINWHVKL
jgi:hypothetical protein